MILMKAVMMMQSELGHISSTFQVERDEPDGGRHDDAAAGGFTRASELAGIGVRRFELNLVKAE